MLISEQKPMEEILSYLDGENNVFIVGCKGCAEGCQTGGEPQAIEMKQKLEEAGKTVTGISLIDFACNEQLTRMTLQAYEEEDRCLRLPVDALLRRRRPGSGIGSG